MALALVLASQSPRRRALLEQAGLRFSVRPADIDETPRSGESAADYVARMAREKASAIAVENEVVLAADTIVVCDGSILGKPENRSHAFEMISQLAGRTHHVMTAFAIATSTAPVQVETVTTEVGFRLLQPHEIERFLDKDEHLDKAGAYGIQSSGGALTSAIQGSYTNVVGLPMAEVLRSLSRAGVVGE